MDSPEASLLGMPSDLAYPDFEFGSGRLSERTVRFLWSGPWSFSLSPFW